MRYSDKEPMLSQVQSDVNESEAMQKLLHEEGEDLDQFEAEQWVYCPKHKWVGIVEDTDGVLVEVSTDQGIQVVKVDMLLRIDPQNVFMQRPAARLRATYHM